MSFSKPKSYFSLILLLIFYPKLIFTQVISAGSNHSLAVCTTGVPKAWGNNGQGQLGDGTTTNKTTPISIGALTNVVDIKGGYYHTLALKNDGTVWSVGYNNYGQLGDGTLTQRLNPVQIGITNVKAISAGKNHSLALKNDGTVWAWGYNNSGQIGDSTNTQRLIPVKVKLLTGVVAIASGYNFSLALKSDGTVWGWGFNGWGQLGSTNISIVPTQMFGINDIVAISGGENHSLMLKNDGTVWACGINNNGELGDSTNTNWTYPVRVKVVGKFIGISAGMSHSLALKSDGTVFAWGLNGNSQLGDGTTANKKFPVQVNALSGVVDIAAGAAHSVALKTDGTLSAWGLNGSGQLNTNGLCSVIKPLNLKIFETHPSCGNNDGNIAVLPNGGSVPYSYLWSNGQTTASISNLSSGSFTITVTDNNNVKISKVIVSKSYLDNTTTLVRTACQSYTSPSGRNIWTTSGTYKDSITYAVGCDSIVTIQLTIKNSKSNIQFSTCNSYSSPSGKYIWSATGTYKDTISNSVGCDSLITISLSVHTPSLINKTALICKGESIYLAGNDQTTAGTYYDTLTTIYGCDSIIATALTVNLCTGKSLLLGMTSSGSDGFGTIFQTDLDGSNCQALPAFIPNSPGFQPQYSQLCAASNGKLYGMTHQGGAVGSGIIFEYDCATNSYTKKFDFGGINGSLPYGSLIEASNGRLYGMTYEGGANNVGVIFEYNYSTNTFTKKIDLSPAIGANPYGSLVQASNGKLYGTTYKGGNSYGALFEYDYTTNIYTKKMDFGSVAGMYPLGSLMEASNGKLYGTTSDGGSNGLAVLFEYDYATDTYTKKTTIGSTHSLIEISNGKLYGLTTGGGANNGGSIFEYDFFSNVKSIKINLSTSTGNGPCGSLFAATNGKFYGMTYAGGVNGYGVIFEYDTTANTYTKKIDLNSASGFQPYGSLVQASNGKLYGMTYGGGESQAGVLFEYDYSSNSYSKKVDISNCSGGSTPYGSLIQASNGLLYGMTNGGGAYRLGVIFEYNYLTKTYTKKIDLNTTTGCSPYGSLIQASNGKLYGMAGGGTNSRGVIFEYDYTNNTYTKKIDFDGTNGSDPRGSLIEASNGKLYGMTSSGGGNGSSGVLFEYDYVTNTYTKKFDFYTNQENGNSPFGSLIETSNGKLYGMTSKGGATTSQDVGVIFEYDYLTNTYTKKLDFVRSFGDAPDGAVPNGTLMKASNGKLYGMTKEGGIHDGNTTWGYGVLFEYDETTNTLRKIMEFDQTTNGSSPFGSLIQSSNGKLYGMTAYGGAYNNGVLFEYDYSSNTFTNKNNFTGKNGSIPYYNNQLVEIHPFNSSSINVSTNHLYVSPSGKYSWNADGIYKDTIVNYLGYDSIITINLTVTCNASYNTIYDTLQNNFTLTVDSTTTAFANTYNWDFGDGSSSTLPTPTHVYTVDTVYNVCLKIKTTSNDSCTYCHMIGKDYLGNIYRTNGFTINVINPNLQTGVSPTMLSENTIIVSPNPTTGDINVFCKNADFKELSVDIVDIQGKVLFSSLEKNIFSEFRKKINLNDFADGIYFLKLHSTLGNFVYKIVVQK